MKATTRVRFIGTGTAQRSALCPFEFAYVEVETNGIRYRWFNEQGARDAHKIFGKEGCLCDITANFTEKRTLQRVRVLTSNIPNNNMR